MFRLTHIVLIGAMVGAAVSVGAEAEMYRGYETPAYDIAWQNGSVELRSYQPHIVAEVTVRGDRGDAISRGFRVLADYIFGGNVDEAKVAMTAPVSQMRADDDDPGTWVVRFMMPEKYTLETLPEPRSVAIRLVETEPQTQIVSVFSGRWSDNRLNDQAEQLREIAELQGLQIDGPPRYYFYDGPFTLPWNRRNEVAFAVN